MDAVTAHIEVSPEIAGGKPRIAGHRITVQNIAIWHERLNMTADQIAGDYGLSLSEVYAALSYYYYDKRDEIDRQMSADNSFVQELRRGMLSKVTEKLEGA